MNAYDTFATPLGRFTVVVDATGAVGVAAFGELDDIRHLTGAVEVTEAPELTAEARRQVEAYFAGDRRNFDLTLAEPATDFQRRYRAEMASLGYGVTTTYGELAKRFRCSTGILGNWGSATD